MDAWTWALKGEPNSLMFNPKKVGLADLHKM